MSTGVSKAQEALKQDPFSNTSVWDQEFLKRDTEMANLIKKYQTNTLPRVRLKNKYKKYTQNTLPA
jgi:hypothetical protein